MLLLIIVMCCCLLHLFWGDYRLPARGQLMSTTGMPKELMKSPFSSFLLSGFTFSTTTTDDLTC